MHFNHQALRITVLLAAGIFLTGCNPATKGWSTTKGTNVSLGRLVAAKQNCHYPRARQRAINLLEAEGNKARNERRAANILHTAEQCMRKHGVNYNRRAYGIGKLRIR